MIERSEIIKQNDKEKELRKIMKELRKKMNTLMENDAKSHELKTKEIHQKKNRII